MLGWLFAALTGLSSTLGASGGPVILAYLLMLNMPKDKLIGTSAFFCFLVDIVKLPLYIFLWHNITRVTFITSLLMSPLIVLGFVLGLLLVAALDTLLPLVWKEGVRFRPKETA